MRYASPIFAALAGVVNIIAGQVDLGLLWLFAALIYARTVSPLDRRLPPLRPARPRLDPSMPARRLPPEEG